MTPSNKLTKSNDSFSYAVTGDLLDISSLDLESNGIGEHWGEGKLYLDGLDVLLFGSSLFSEIIAKVGARAILTLISEQPRFGIQKSENNSLMFTHRSRRSIERLEREVAICIIDSGISSASNIAIAESASFSRGRADCDETGHGTMVAHTIADNNPPSDYCGIAMGARVLSAKVDDFRGGRRPESRLLRAINWAITKRAEVVNLSIGYDRSAHDPYRPVTKLLQRYISIHERPIFVASAGNKHTGVSDPAAANGVIAVAGSRGYSHDPNTPQCAPAGAITFSANSAGFDCRGYINALGCDTALTITSFAGTSAACAVATAMVARVLAKSPTAPRADILNQLSSIAKVPSNWDSKTGGFGIVGPFS